MSDASQQTFVGIDIGGMNTRLAIVDTCGRILADRSTETPTGNNGEDLIYWLDDSYGQCRSETDSFPDPEAIGVAVPGVLEPGRSAVVRALNLPYLEGLPIRNRLVEATGLRTFIDCDAVAAAWAEFCARERSPRRMSYLAVGTGIAAAVIIDGQIVRHTDHSAGHVGHLVCDTGDDAPACACGARGCLECCLAGPALNDAARHAGFDSGLAEIEIAYHEGDALAFDFVEGKATLMTRGLTNLTHIYATELLVIGGDVATALPSLVHRAAQLMNDAQTALTPDGARVELAGLGEFAGVVGAALLAAQCVRR